MNLSDIHKLSNKEIVQSIARMVDSPIEKAMRAELDVRFLQAVTDLSSNVYSLRLTLDKIDKSSKSSKLWRRLISFLLIAVIGILLYYMF